MIMRRAFLGVSLACFAAAAGCHSSAAGETATQAATSAKPAAVIMAVNLGEEDEQGGCGDVIHAVRAAAPKGVRTREIDTRKKDEMTVASKKYRIVVQPTVVLVDDADNEVRRYEGESKDTIAALKADLDRLTQK